MDTLTAKIAALAGKMELEKKARKDAGEHKPAGDSQDDWKGIRDEIVDTVSTAGRGDLKKIGDDIDAASDAIDELRDALSNTHLPRRDDKGKLVRSEVPSAEFDAVKQNLAAAGRRKGEAIEAYDNFKDANGLTREASGDDRGEQIKWLIVIAVGEGAANSYFLKDISSGGLAEGFFWAFAIAVMNVLFAALGGAIGLRYLINHKDVGKKIAALIWSLGCLMFCLAIVAAAASFRGYASDLLAGGETPRNKIMSDAWDIMIGVFHRDGFEITTLFLSLDSSLLFATGIACMIGGFYKGYQFDDPYPGYGQKARGKNKAEEDYDDALGAVQIKYESAHSDLKKSCEEMQKKTNELRATFSNHDFKGQLVSIAQALLLKYSRKNAEIRQDGAPRMPENLFDGIDDIDSLQTQYGVLSKRFSDEKIVENSETEARRFGLIPSKYPGERGDPGEQS